MRKMLMILAAFAAALSLQAAPALGETENIDTLRSAVVTGTRVAMERDRVAAPVSVVRREAIALSDESALMERPNWTR